MSAYDPTADDDLIPVLETARLGMERTQFARDQAPRHPRSVQMPLPARLLDGRAGRHRGPAGYKDVMALAAGTGHTSQALLQRCERRGIPLAAAVRLGLARVCAHPDAVPLLTQLGTPCALDDLIYSWILRIAHPEGAQVLIPLKRLDTAIGEVLG